MIRVDEDRFAEPRFGRMRARLWPLRGFRNGHFSKPMARTVTILFWNFNETKIAMRGDGGADL